VSTSRQVLGLKPHHLQTQWPESRTAGGSPGAPGELCGWGAMPRLLPGRCRLFQQTTSWQSKVERSSLPAMEYGNACVQRANGELQPGDACLAGPTPKPLHAPGHLRPGAGSIAPASLTTAPASPRVPGRQRSFSQGSSLKASLFFSSRKSLPAYEQLSRHSSCSWISRREGRACRG